MTNVKYWNCCDVFAHGYRLLCVSLGVFSLFCRIGTRGTRASIFQSVSLFRSMLYAWLVSGEGGSIGVHCGPHARGPVRRRCPWLRAFGPWCTGGARVQWGPQWTPFLWTPNLNPVKHTWSPYSTRRGLHWAYDGTWIFLLNIWLKEPVLGQLSFQRPWSVSVSMRLSGVMLYWLWARLMLIRLKLQRTTVGNSRPPEKL